MRNSYAYSGTSLIFALSVLTSSLAFGQGSVSDLSVTNYQIVSEQRATITQSYFTYRADIVNTGRGRDALTATVTSKVPSVQVVSGQGSLRFAPVPANSQVTSGNTFMILVDRSVPFNFANLQWTFIAPVANAGPNQTAAVGSTVSLNGSASSNPSGVGTLTYNWAFLSRPPGTSTTLANATGLMPSFVVDIPGTYVLKLTVSNGAGTDSATVTVSTFNSPPVASAGPNQTIPLGSTVTLNGGGSSDVDGDPITFLWSLVSRPAGSAAVLAGASSISPTLVADKAGSYLAQLVVHDGKVNSVPATVTITTQNTPPVANAGANQSVNIGAVVQLNGSGSTDVDGDTLTFQWSLITVPAGSTASLSSLTAINPTFTADRQGTYVAQLTVRDGKVDSVPATTTITTNALQAPTANPGLNQTVKHGTTVTLNGSGTDPQSLPVTILWSLINKPAGSAAVLSSTTVTNPTFVADKFGSYTVQLVVNNGTLNSAPATVTITTTNTAPVANPGPPQSVPVATTVTLNGSGSSDSDNDPLSYSWSFTSRPAGSSASLAAASSSSPTFFADVAGPYVVQLIVNDGITNGNPATVTITVVAPQTITLTPDPLNIFNAPGTLTVTLPAPAGIGGQLIKLAILDPSVATIQADVTIPQDATTATVIVSPVGTGSTLASASAPGLRSGTATVHVAVPSISVTLASGTVGLTKTINGSVTLNTPAPAGGTLVNLSGLPAGVVILQPTSVSIAAGSTTGTFTVTGAAEGSAAITASSPGYSSGSASINVGKLGQITLQSNVTVGPGQSVPMPVSLATAAPVGGVTITLTSSDPSKATVTASVVIAQGDTSPATQPQVTGINFGSTIISVSAPGFTGDSKTAAVAANLSFAPPALTVGAGGSQNLTLSLSSPAPAGGLTISLSSNNTGAATVPASVTIAQNNTSVIVPVTGVGAGSATISANAGIASVVNASATANVVVFGSINLPVNTTVGLGQSVPFAVSLSSIAPVGGVVVTLASSDPSKATLSTTSVTIPAGSTTPAVQPQVSGVNLGSVTVSASAPGYGFTSQSVQVTASLSFAPPSLTIVGAATQNLTLTLSGPAPAGGLIINVSSSNTGVATVPGTVTIAQAASSVTVPVTGLSAGSTVIHASTASVADTTANVTVQSSGAIGLQSNVTVAPGASAALALTLPGPAPSNVTVALSSGDPSKVTVSPASVTILAGLTQPSQQPQVTGVNFGSAIITASAPGYVPGSQTVQVGASLSFSPPSLTFAGLGTQNLTLNLSATAPSGGLVVNLSSSVPLSATVPSSVTIAQNASSVTVPVTALGSGATVITASSSAPNVAGATANVSVQSLGVISLPASATVGLGQSLTFPVTLPGPAPAAGATITLSSSDSSKLTISPSTVTILAGQSQPAQQPQVTGVSLGSANIGASSPGYTSASQPVQVTATISFTPASLTISGIGTQDLTLTLSGPAPAGGLTINVSSSNTGTATVPATVVIPAGTTTVPVPVTSVAVGTTVIHASAPNLADTTANVTVTEPVDIILPANVTVPPGEQAAFPVSLAKPAVDATFIILTSSDPSFVTLSQQTIFINAGQTTPASQPKVNGISTGSVTITASAYGLQSASTTVVSGFGLSFSPSTLTITGTATQNLTLVLSGPAPNSGLSINIASSNTAAATVPGSVIFAASATTVNVPVTGVAPGSATITASSAIAANATANVTVVSPGVITLPSNVSVPLDKSAQFPVTLSTPAPFGGVTVTLVSSDTAKLTISPASVFIADGATQPATQPSITGVNVGSVNVSASAPGYSSATQQVQVNATVTFTTPSISMGVGGTQNLLLALSGSAPWAGLTVTLTSSNTGVATLQQSVNFFPDGSEFTTVLIPVLGVGPGTATIHASGINIPDTTATVTVVGPLTITTTSLGNGTVHAPYSHTLTAAGGSTPYSWTLTSGTLPAGLSLNASTGLIGGTATAPVSSTPLTFRVTDTSSPVQTATANLTLTIVAATAASIGATSGTPQSAAISTAFAAPLVATVKDSGNNPVSGVTVTFTAPGSGASGTFAGGVNTAITNATGVATSATFTANSTTGSYAVTASVAGVATPASFSLTNTVGTPASITATGGTPQSAAISTAFAAPLVATVKDAGNNPLSGVTVTFSAPGSGASGSFAGGVNTAVTNASGVATSVAFAPNSTTGAYAVTASVAGVATPASFSLTNTVGTPGSITATGGTPQSAAISTAFAAPLVATVKDSGNNPVSGVTVTFAAPGSGASGTFAGGVNTAVTNASGVATSPTFTANSTSGAYVVTASASGVASPANFSLTNTVGAAASITPTSGTPQSAAISTAFAAPLAATVKDAGNNPVSGVTVTFTAPGSGASGTFAGGVNTAVTNASGVATSAAFTANSTMGAYAVTASASGVASPASFSLTNTVGTPASIAATGGTPQSAAISTAFSAPLVATVKDAGNNPVSGVTVTFTAPGSGARGTFAGGVNTAITNASGVATSATFTANSTTGAYAVTASASGVASPASFSLTNTVGAPASITATSGTPQSAATSTAFAAPLVATVKDAGNNPVSGVTVTFAAPGSGASGTFAGGVNTAITNASGVATSAAFSANSTAGPYAVTASVVGVATPASFSLTNSTPPPASITATSGTPQSATVSTAFSAPLVATVKDAGNNPVSGVTVTFTAPGSGASGSFAGGGNTAVTNASGVATSAAFTANGTAGSYTVNASVTGVAALASFSLTNTPVSSGPQVTISGATVGQNLQTAVTVSIPQAAPPGGLRVNVTSGNPTLVLLAGRPGDNGSAQVSLTIGEGLTTVGGIFVQGLSASGSAQLTASATGYSSGTSTVTLSPSGFVLTAQANPVGVISFTVPAGVTNTPVRVHAARLDSSLNYVEDQAVRGGIGVTITISNPTSSVGSVSPTSMVIAGGDTLGNATFNALATGAMTFGATVPAGFSLPASGASMTANVTPSGLIPANVTVGQNLETSAQIGLNGTAPTGGLLITLTSSDSSKVLFSTAADTAGSGSLTLNVQGGRSISPEFFVQALSNTGAVTYTATSPGFGTATGTVTLRPSGFVIYGPFGLGADFFTTSGAANSDLTIYSVLLDNTLNFVASQAVRGGFSATVEVKSANAAAGTITIPFLTFTGGSTSADTQFHPVGAGTSAISAIPPSGFSTPAQSGSLTASVIMPGLVIDSGVDIGNNLQATGTLLLGQPAPSGGLAVTLTSSSGQLRLSTSPTTAGSSSITITVPAGQNSANYYLQGLGDSGSPTYTATAPGYNPRTGTVFLAPSGVVIEGPSGSFPFSAPVGGGNRTLTVSTALLNAGLGFVSTQPLAGGLSLPVILGNTHSAFGTVTSPVTIAGGSDNATSQFTPVAAGSTTISVTQPSGYSLPSSRTTVTANVQ
jgi:hypothetical protein